MGTVNIDGSERILKTDVAIVLFYLFSYYCFVIKRKIKLINTASAKQQKYKFGVFNAVYLSPLNKVYIAFKSIQIHASKKSMTPPFTLRLKSEANQLLEDKINSIPVHAIVLFRKVHHNPACITIH